MLFEEIVVVAQKREQNIMEVPVAVSAVTAQQIEDAGIKDVYDLQQNVPGLIIGRSQTATTTNFSIRGIGSTTNNFGVESSVGLYVDGVYRSRQSSLINELIDVEAVEVLRGPQGTLFGKNTPAGALQVRTVAPSQERDAFVDVTAGDYGLVRVAAASNFPINDDWSARGTIFTSQRDGYVDDINLGDDLYNDRDRQGARLQLAYEPSDSFNMRIIADYAEIDESCCGTVALVDYLFSRASVEAGAPSPGTDAVLLTGFGATIFTDYPYPQPLLDGAFGPFADNIITGSGTDDYVTAYNAAPTSENEDTGLSLEFNKSFDNGMTLTSISAYRSFDTYDFIDLDFTNADIGYRINDAQQSSFSQEFRLAGEFGTGGNWVAGAYYFSQEIDQITITDGVSPNIETYFGFNPTFNSIIAGVNAVNAAVIADPDGMPGSGDEITLGDVGYPTAGEAFPLGLGSQDDIVQDQDGWAVFGQVDIPIGEDFILTLGGRYTDEQKDIDATYTQNIPLSQTPPDFGALQFQLCLADPLNSCDLPLGTPGFIFSPVDPMTGLPNPETLAVFQPFGEAGWGSYAVPPIVPREPLDDTLSDDQFTGTVKLSWFPSDATMVYASFSTGFKSGGTNTERIDPAFDPLFGAETSESFEIGFKGDIGPVRLALTYYDTTFDDFQEQTFTGFGFNLQNAGSIENNGVEVEALWRPFDGTDVQLIYTHNEGEFESFEAGTCQVGFPIHSGMPDPGLPDDLSALDPRICSRTGDPIGYNPEDRLFLAVQQELVLSDSTTMYARIEYSSASEQFTNGNLDPLGIQDDFEIVNARLGFNFDSWNSSLTIWGRNITDERYFVGSFDAPVQDGRMNAYPAEPSTFGITFRKNFE